jgi:hypothetical protein
MATCSINRIEDSSNTYYIVPNLSVSTTTSSTASSFVGSVSCDSSSLVFTYYTNLSTSGSITAANFTSTSDARLKNSIVNTLIDYNSILDNLEIKDFYFNSDEKKESKQIGLVAQDLEKIIPDDYKNCFIKKDDKGYYSINEIKLVYLALLKIKELEKRLKEIEDTTI